MAELFAVPSDDPDVVESLLSRQTVGPRLDHDAVVAAIVGAEVGFERFEKDFGAIARAEGCTVEQARARHALPIELSWSLGAAREGLPPGMTTVSAAVQVVLEDSFAVIRMMGDQDAFDQVLPAVFEPLEAHGLWLVDLEEGVLFERGSWRGDTD